MTRRQEPQQCTGKVQEKLITLFAPEQLETLAWQSRGIQRASSQLTGADFFALMPTDMLDNPAVSCGGRCALLAPRHPAAAMTPQAFQQRLHTPEAVASLHDVVQVALRAPLTPLSAPWPAAVLASCGRVCLEESTHCCRHETLAEAFKGSGGSASRSTVTSDVIDALLAHQLQARTVTHGRAAAQGLATAIRSSRRAGDLVIRD